jgi:hypothetical protein
MHKLQTYEKHAAVSPGKIKQHTASKEMMFLNNTVLGIF